MSIESSLQVIGHQSQVIGHLSQVISIFEYSLVLLGVIIHYGSLVIGHSQAYFKKNMTPKWA